MRRPALAIALCLVGCGGRTRDVRVAAGDGDPRSIARAHLLAGRASDAVATLAPLRDRLDADGLALLGRAELAAGRDDDGRRTLEAAVTRAEHGTRGAWSWQPSDAEPARQIAFTADGRVVAMDGDGTIRIWDPLSGRTLAAIPASVLYSVRVDGRRMIVAGGNGPVQIWDLAHDAPVRTHDLAWEGPAAFTPDGNLIARDPTKRDLVEVEPATNRERAHFADDVYSMSIDGDTILTERYTKDGSDITLWDRAAHYKKLATIPVVGAVWFLRRLPSGALLVGLAARLTIGDVQDGKQRHARLIVIDPATRAQRVLVASEPGGALALPHELDGAVLAPDRSRLVVTTSDGAAHLIDLATTRVIRTLVVGDGQVVVHPNGQLLAVANAGGFALWNLETGARTTRWNRSRAVLAVDFDAEGRRLAIGQSSGTATMWDLTANTLVAVTPRADAPVQRVAFSHSGVLATGSKVEREWIGGRSLDVVAAWRADGTKLWEKSVERLAWLAYRPGSDELAIASIARKSDGGGETVATILSPAGGELRAVAHGSEPPFAWRFDGGIAHRSQSDQSIVLDPPRGSPQPLAAGALELAFQPGTTLVALAEQEGRLSFWDTKTSEPVSVVADESGTATRLAWTRDGAIAASAAAATVRLWDPRSAVQLATLTARARVTALAFHPGGRYVAVGTIDGTVELFAIATGKVVATLAVLDPGRGIAWTPDGAVDGTLAVGDPLGWSAGGTTLPGLGAWERARVPGLVAARLAQLPAETAPRKELHAAPAPPPSCFREHGDDNTVTSWRVDGNAIDLCIAQRGEGHVPVCFTADLATRVYRPRAPSPQEQLGRRGPSDASHPTITRDGTTLEVCRAGACRRVVAKELADMKEPEYEASDSGALLVVSETTWTSAHPAALYDVATGKKLRTLALDKLFGATAGASSIEFVGETLLATSTPCAGPCSSSVLVDPRTGRTIAAVGGADNLNTSELSAARVSGDVFAFNDAMSPLMIYQNVRTGRVVRKFERPGTCGADSCAIHMLHTATGVAVLTRDGHVGDITLLDGRGAVSSELHAPICK